MSEQAANCAVIEGHLPATSGGTFHVLEVRFKSSIAEMSNQTQAAWLKILLKKPQERYVRLQFNAKVSFFFLCSCGRLRHHKPQSQNLRFPL